MLGPTVGDDGSGYLVVRQWELVETVAGRRDGKYRVVTRVSSGDQEFEEAARVFVRLAGLELPPEMKRRE